MIDTHALLIVIIAAVVTIAIRFLPFIIFGGNRKTPAFVTYLGTVLPYAIMAMLVIYCIKDINFMETVNYLPTLIAVAFTALLHAIKKNTLLSIIGGTICYMILIQFVFV